ncbi:MAG TPA: SLC45 family MFS transporter [Dehalococcoidia bacterium]|nr:SLC45 family MFS transporter [Dehalococcoidia bacterium]
MENRKGNNNNVTGSPRFAPVDYIKITILGFGLTALWASLNNIVLPKRLLDFVDESMKNSYLGYLTFAGSVLAMLVQPLVGAASDRSRFSWGRRRPYILAGTILLLLFLPGIGLWESYAAVFVCYCLMQIASNTAQGPYQGFIPDLVPEGKRGLASGVKGLLEIIGGASLLLLTSNFIDRYSPGEEGYWLWLTLGALGVVFLITALITLITVRERPGTGRQIVASSGSRVTLVDLLKGLRTYIKQHRDFIWFLVSRGILGMPGVILQTFAYYYLQDVIGVEKPAGAATNLVIVVTAGIITVVYFTGRLSDRIGRKPIMLFSGLIGAVGIVLLYLSDSYTQVLIGGAFIGLASGAFLSASWAMATDIAAEGEEAKYLGLTNLAMTAGSALARLIGPVIDFFNNTVAANSGYSVMLLVCLLCFVLGSLLVLKVRGVR